MREAQTKFVRGNQSNAKSGGIQHLTQSPNTFFTCFTRSNQSSSKIAISLHLNTPLPHRISSSAVAELQSTSNLHQFIRLVLLFPFPTFISTNFEKNIPKSKQNQNPNRIEELKLNNHGEWSNNRTIRILLSISHALTRYQEKSVTMKKGGDTMAYLQEWDFPRWTLHCRFPSLLILHSEHELCCFVREIGDVLLEIS